MSSQTISPRSIVSAVEGHLSSDLDGEAAILNLQNGVYYSLNPLGARIWTLVQAPTTIERLRDTIVEEYDVEPEQCERDLFALVRKLASAGLIELRREEPAGPPLSN